MEKIAEVIEASTGEFLAQSYELHRAPALGSLVKTWAPPAVADEPGASIFAVICHSSTSSMEPGRRPTARGRDLDDEEDIYRQNPQLSRLLCTTFKALIVGHQDGAGIHYFLPPRPPRVHAFVYPCPQEEVAAFTQNMDFLTVLLGASVPIPVEELVAACLRTAAGAHADIRPFLVRAGKELALLLAAEPARLNSILRKMRP